MKALKGYTASYEISIKNKEDPLIQLQNTRKAVETHIDKVLASIKGLKFIETWKVKFEKPREKAFGDEKNENVEKDSFGKEYIVKEAYFNSKAQTIINKTQIELSFTYQNNKY